MDSLVARAPARIDFGGGWTDVPPYSDERGGIVCSAAIELYAVAEVRQAPDGSGRVKEVEDALAMAALARAGASGASLRLTADYPTGAGLGGSSAAGVAALGALSEWQGRSPSPHELAEESRRLEVEDMGIAGGRQDHYAAAFGGVLGLWFGGGAVVRHLNLDGDTIDSLSRRCIVAYTGQSRLSAESITAVTGAYRGGDRSVVEKLDRMRDLAGEMIAALDARDIDSLGALVGEHWIHQRALHPAIPTPLIDRLLEVAASAGATGGKALGASGGGCVLAIAPEDRVASVRDSMAQLALVLPTPVSRLGFHVVKRGASVEH